jgi:hypothetical protein
MGRYGRKESDIIAKVPDVNLILMHRCVVNDFKGVENQSSFSARSFLLILLQTHPCILLHKYQEVDSIYPPFPLFVGINGRFGGKAFKTLSAGKFCKASIRSTR